MWSLPISLFVSDKMYFQQMILIFMAIMTGKENITQEIIILDILMFYLIQMYIRHWILWQFCDQISIHKNMLTYLPSFVNGLHTFAVVG